MIITMDKGSTSTRMANVFRASCWKAKESASGRCTTPMVTFTKAVGTEGIRMARGNRSTQTDRSTSDSGRTTNAKAWGS